MSTKIVEKRGQRAEIVKQMRSLLDEAETRGGMTAEDEQKYSRMEQDEERLAKEIDREERMLSKEREMEQRGGTIAGQQQIHHEGLEGRRRVESDEYRSAFKAWAIGGLENLNGEQRSLLAPERRAMAVGTATAGGYTVPQGFYNEIIQAQKFYGGMRRVGSTIIRTASGNDLPIPTNDDTGNIGAILAENASGATGGTDPVFGQKILKAWKFTSKTILVPIELLQDSAFDLEAWLSVRIGERIGRSENSFYTNGTGSNQPQGIITSATVGKTGATGQTTSVTYDDLVDLIHSVDIAYRDKASFCMHDQTLKALKKMKDGYGRPLWLPGLALKEPDTINGYSYCVNNDIPQMAAGAKSIAFGDFSNYFIRDVMDLQLVRISEKYIESGQIGFIAFSRHDGQYINAGQNPITLYQNSAS